MKILAADFGTSSVKLGVYTREMIEIVSTNVGYKYESDGTTAQIDPEVIYSAFIKGCHNLGDILKTVDILAFCAFSPSLIAMDIDGNAVYPCIVHLDRRSYKQSRYALNQLPKETFIEINGNLPFAGGISSTSILWIKQEQPELFKKTYMLGHLSTFLHKRFVGKFIIDLTNASFTGLFETFTKKGWSPVITDALGIDRRLLPELRPSLSIAGELRGEVAEAAGLKNGLPVLVGANDSTSAAYGAGAFHNGDITNISGSSEIMVMTTDKPVPHAKYYSRVSVEEDKWIHLAITVGGFALEWFKKEFCREMSDEFFYGNYLKETVSEGIKKDKVRFLPHLSGDRHSLVRKRGAFSGLTMETTREDMLRALLTGTFDPILTALDIIKKSTKLNTNIYWTGAMISEEYQRFKEQVFHGYHFIPCKNCSSLGMVRGAVVTLERSI